MTLLLEAATAEDLRRELAALDLRVSPRGHGRTKEQTERYCAAHLLSALPPEYLSFPLVVEHGDRPDFTISSVAGSIGIEVTEAVPENHARESALRQSGIGPRVHFIRRHQPGEPPQSNDVLRGEILADQGGEPWEGNEPERLWARVMRSTIEAKAQSTHKPGFKLHPRSWLLIYCNWPLPGVHHKEAVELLSSACQSGTSLHPFHRVFVLDSQCICEVSTAPTMHALRPPAAGA